MTGIRRTRPHHGGDAGQVDRAAEALLARAAMHKNGGHARLFQHARQVRRRQILLIPTQPHFRRHGNFHRLDHAAHQARRWLQFRHHGRAAAHAADLAHRAAHVDIHRRHADGFEIAAASRISSGTEPKSWTARGWSAGRVSISLRALAIFLQQRAGVDQIGRGEVQPADFAHRQPERQVGVTRQRRKKQVGLQLERAD